MGPERRASVRGGGPGRAWQRTVRRIQGHVGGLRGVSGGLSGTTGPSSVRTSGPRRPRLPVGFDAFGARCWIAGASAPLRSGVASIVATPSAITGAADRRTVPRAGSRRRWLRGRGIRPEMRKTASGAVAGSSSRHGSGHRPRRLRCGRRGQRSVSGLQAPHASRARSCSPPVAPRRPPGHPAAAPPGAPESARRGPQRPPFALGGSPAAPRPSFARPGGPRSRLAGPRPPRDPRSRARAVPVRAPAAPGRPAAARRSRVATSWRPGAPGWPRGGPGWPRGGPGIALRSLVGTGDAAPPERTPPGSRPEGIGRAGRRGRTE